MPERKKKKESREAREELTSKQKKLLDIVTDNYREGKVMTKTELLQKAGYTEQTSFQPSRILNSPVLKREMKTVLEKIEEEQNAILEEMKKKRKQAKYGELVRGLSVTTHNSQLLKGESTENIAVQGIEYIVPPESQNTEL